MLLYDVADFRHWKAVEGAGNWQSVGAHVFKHHPVPKFHVWKRDVFNDAVEPVTCGAPNAAGNPPAFRVLLEWYWADHLVVVQNAVETSVDAVVDVVHAMRLESSALVVHISDFADRVNVAGQCESGSHIVSAWFGNNTHAHIAEEVIQSVVYHLGNLETKEENLMQPYL